MIQRIQTVYLLIIVALMIVCMCLPIGSIITADNEISDFYNLYVALGENVKDYSPFALFVLLLIVAVSTTIEIFLFKNRMLQIRFSIFNMILLLGYYAVVFIYACYLPADDTSFTPSWVVCLPFVAFVLNWLAIRGIGADEALVRSYEHLR